MPALLSTLHSNPQGVHSGTPTDWSLHDYGDVVYGSQCNSARKCFDYPSAQRYFTMITNAYSSKRPRLWFTEQGPALRIGGSTTILNGNYQAQVEAAQRYKRLAHSFPRAGREQTFYELFGQSNNFDSAVVKPPDENDPTPLSQRQFRPTYCVLTNQSVVQAQSFCTAST
jgi:hypothetical protein